MKYVYPAIFTLEDNRLYSVRFPDIDGCYTSGDDLQDAFEMAEDALALMLFHYEQENRDIPEASTLNSFDTSTNEFVNYVSCDTIEYQKRNNNKAVKKTLSIPEWLNELATSKGINFSQVLQDALRSQLGV